jgi:CTP:phosphocholine cytidylyltransferase-like protein
MPTQLKSNITTIYLFPGYSREQFQYILRQIPLNKTWQEAYCEYQQLKKNNKMVVDTITGKITFE